MFYTQVHALYPVRRMQFAVHVLHRLCKSTEIMPILLVCEKKYFYSQNKANYSVYELDFESHWLSGNSCTYKTMKWMTYWFTTNSQTTAFCSYQKSYTSRGDMSAKSLNAINTDFKLYINKVSATVHNKLPQQLKVCNIA